MASQIAFGVVACIVAVRQERVSTRENLPSVERAGIEAPGIIPRGSGEKQPRTHFGIFVHSQRSR